MGWTSSIFQLSSHPMRNINKVSKEFNYIYLYVHCLNLVDRDECNSVLPLGGIYLNSFETLFIFLIGCDDS
jgi:hypothetical protein